MRLIKTEPTPGASPVFVVEEDRMRNKKEHSQETEKIRKLAFKLLGKELHYKPGARVPHGAAEALARELGVSEATARNLFSFREPGPQSKIILKHLFRLHKISD